MWFVTAFAGWAIYPNRQKNRVKISRLALATTTNISESVRSGKFKRLH